MADLNSLTAYRAIVDNQGKPLPEFMLMWQEVVQRLETPVDDLSVLISEDQQQIVNSGSIFVGGLALTLANALREAAGATVRAGIGLQFVNTSGATWVNAGSETLSTVSAGDLLIYNTGPVRSLGANGETFGEYRIVEDGTDVLFTGTWVARGDGVNYSLVVNEDFASTLTFSSGRSSTGTVTYDLEVRVTSGPDVQLLAYLYVERT